MGRQDSKGVRKKEKERKQSQWYDKSQYHTSVPYPDKKIWSDTDHWFNFLARSLKVHLVPTTTKWKIQEYLFGNFLCQRSEWAWFSLIHVLWLLCVAMTQSTVTS